MLGAQKKATGRWLFFNTKLKSEKLTSSRQRWRRLPERQQQPVQRRRKQLLLVRELLQERGLLRVQEREQEQALLLSYHKRPERRQR